MECTETAAQQCRCVPRVSLTSAASRCACRSAPQLWGRAGLQAGAAWCVRPCPYGNNATLQGSTAAAGSGQGQARADGDRDGMLAAFLVACRPHTRHESQEVPCQVRACMR